LTRNYVVRAIPTSAKDLMEDRLEKWDQSGEVLLCKDLAETNTYSARLYTLYDQEALYLAVAVRDATPMTNHVDPAKDPDKGWQGDCVQIRFKSSGDSSSEVVWLDSWYYTDSKSPVMQILYPDLAKGGEHRPRINAIDSGGAYVSFQTDADSKGYLQKMRIPWALLLMPGQPTKAGTAYRMGIEVVWGSPTPGGPELYRITDVVARKNTDTMGFYGNPKAWGELRLLDQGNLPPLSNQTPDSVDAPSPPTVSATNAVKRNSPGWQEGVEDITYPCSADSSKQPALFFNPKAREPVPLLVGLHSWSTSYRDGGLAEYATWCRNQGWVMILPNFRGPNSRPEATGSDMAVQDILDAVEYAKKNANVDPRRIYLIGASGGGHMALLMAGRAPTVWTAVAAGVPISDLKAWDEECQKAGRHYAGMIENSCGGPPGKSPEVDEQYKKRSPLTYLANAGSVALDIAAGIHDGHGGSVPISHSLLAFNQVAKESDRLSSEDIQFMVDKQAVPPHLQSEVTDPDYGATKILFRRSSGNARVTIFEGGHGFITEAELKWLARQEKK
jgi:poly(3-hydroxybutyrate) depolymerase